MSYREGRLFVDALRGLGFKESLTESSFAKPNFELLADILEFLCDTLDPRNKLPDEIATENDRVTFVRKALSCILSRTGIKLNSKFVYQADVFAIKELLKIVTFLRTPSDGPLTTSPSGTSPDCKAAHHRLLESLGQLFRLLLQKPDFAISELISDLPSLVQGDEDNITIAEQTLAECLMQESRLSSLVQKRRAELERTNRRLATIKSVRPGFLDEYRQLEEELSELYTAYVGKFKILDYNEHQLDLLNLTEQRKMEAREEAVALQNKKLREDEWRAMRGDSSTTKAGSTPTVPVSAQLRQTSGVSVPEEDEVSIEEDDGESGKGDSEDLYQVEDDEDNADF